MAWCHDVIRVESVVGFLLAPKVTFGFSHFLLSRKSNTSAGSCSFISFFILLIFLKNHVHCIPASKKSSNKTLYKVEHGDVHLQ